MSMRKMMGALTSFALSLLIPAMAWAAGDVDIGTGITQVDKAALAARILKIGEAVGGTAGAIAVLALVFLGLKMATAANESARAGAKEQFIWVLIGLGVIGLAVTVVGFIAWVVKQ